MAANISFLSPHSQEKERESKRALALTQNWILAGGVLSTASQGKGLSVCSLTLSSKRGVSQEGKRQGLGGEPEPWPQAPCASALGPPDRGQGPGWEGEAGLAGWVAGSSLLCPPRSKPELLSTCPPQGNGADLTSQRAGGHLCCPCGASCCGYSPSVGGGTCLLHPTLVPLHAFIEHHLFAVS